jgi:hypothetical protein
MANTFQLISSSTLATDTASVTFSAIPQTYTDLILKISTRATDTGQYLSPQIRFNSLSTSIYSWVFIGSYSTTTNTDRSGSTTSARVTYSATASDATASTFGSAEIYIPQYTTSQVKQITTTGVAATNAGSSFQGITANYLNSAVAITSMEISAGFVNAYNWKTGSSFHLYGIKNS